MNLRAHASDQRASWINQQTASPGGCRELDPQSRHLSDAGFLLRHVPAGAPLYARAGPAVAGQAPPGAPV